MNGNLFTTDFLLEGIKETPEWLGLSDQDVDRFVEEAHEILGAVPAGNRENECVTEEHIIKPIFRLLGWEQLLPVQNLSAKDRD